MLNKRCLWILKSVFFSAQVLQEYKLCTYSSNLTVMLIFSILKKDLKMDLWKQNPAKLSLSYHMALKGTIVTRYKRHHFVEFVIGFLRYGLNYRVLW